MKCQTCGKDRIINVYAKCNDLCCVEFKGEYLNGYVLKDLNIGDWGSHVDIFYCLNCGQIQGNWPIKSPNMER